MPLQRCTLDGSTGYRWGNSGKCYIGPDAKAKALRQGRAIESRVRNRTRIVPGNPLKADPTRTATLRRRFEAEFNKRWLIIKGRILALVVDEDAFGLRTERGDPFTRRSSTQPIGDLDPDELLRQPVDNEVANQRFRFRTDAEKAEAFRRWFSKQTDEILLQGSKGAHDPNWWNRYIEDGYKKGAGRAFDDVRKPALAQGAGNLDFFKGTKDEFLRSAFARPETVQKVQTLAGRVFTDLKGVTEATSQQLTRELTQGLARGQNPHTVARSINRRVDAVGVHRSRLLARTEIIRAHGEGQLDAMENLDVVSVGVMAEWSTAGDDRVCPLCASLEGIVMTVKEARGTIPRHPQCRCTYIPAQVGESPKGQKKSQSSLRKARDESIRRETPKRLRDRLTIREQRRRSRWVGADVDFAKVRPKSVLDDTPKVVPPTAPKAPKPRPKAKGPTDDELRALPLEERLAKDPELVRLVDEVAAIDTSKYEAALVELNDKVSARQLATNRLLEAARPPVTVSQSKIDALTKVREKAKAIEAKAKRRVAKEKGDLFRKMVERVSVEDQSKVLVAFDAKLPKFMVTRTSKVADELSKLMSKRKFGNGVRVDVLETSDVRSFARGTSVNLHRDVSLKTTAHEIAHVLEKDSPKTVVDSFEFLAYRTSRSGTKPERMTDVFPFSGYTESEVGNRDDFEKLFGRGSHEAYYAGKTYRVGDRPHATEVLSMGVEQLFENGVEFARRDPEFFKYVVGTLRGRL